MQCSRAATLLFPPLASRRGEYGHNTATHPSAAAVIFAAFLAPRLPSGATAWWRALRTSIAVRRARRGLARAPVALVTFGVLAVPLGAEAAGLSGSPPAQAVGPAPGAWRLGDRWKPGLPADLAVAAGAAWSRGRGSDAPSGEPLAVAVLTRLRPGAGRFGAECGAEKGKATSAPVRPVRGDEAGEFRARVAGTMRAGLPACSGVAEIGRNGRIIGEGDAFLSSLVVPGLAQYRLGSRRWIAYAGAEVLFAAAYGARRSEARDARRGYRDLAWNAARRGVGRGDRLDGGFEYYEAMAHWSASGAWDGDSSRPGLQPETDPATYNGWIWALATALHEVSLDDGEQSPGFERALDYYRRRAQRPQFLWAWRGPDERRRFARLIGRSDRLFGEARRALWIVLANHVASALDGFVAARIAALPGGRLGVVVAARTR